MTVMIGHLDPFFNPLSSIDCVLFCCHQVTPFSNNSGPISEILTKGSLFNNFLTLCLKCAQICILHGKFATVLAGTLLLISLWMTPIFGQNLSPSNLRVYEKPFEVLDNTKKKKKKTFFFLFPPKVLPTGQNGSKLHLFFPQRV